MSSSEAEKIESEMGLELYRSEPADLAGKVLLCQDSVDCSAG